METNQSDCLKRPEADPRRREQPGEGGQGRGMDPPFIARAEGCFLWDADGNRYIDYVCSWGPMILGHAHPEVVKALQERIAQGTSYGAPTELEVEMAGRSS